VLPIIMGVMSVSSELEEIYSMELDDSLTELEDLLPELDDLLLELELDDLLLELLEDFAMLLLDGSTISLLISIFILVISC